MGGTSDVRINDPRNLIRLCGTGTTGCHGWVESHRTEALRTGWLVASLEDFQLDRPLVNVWGGRVRLDAAGGRVDLPEDGWPA